MRMLLLNTQELTKLASQMRASQARIHKGANKELKAVALDTERLVKVLMPVLTGRAKSSWSHWTNDMVLANPDAKPADAIWQEEDLAITQGTSVPYVEGLNDGTIPTKKAAPGFIDTAGDKGVEDLAKKLAAMIQQVL